MPRGREASNIIRNRNTDHKPNLYLSTQRLTTESGALTSFPEVVRLQSDNGQHNTGHKV